MKISVDSFQIRQGYILSDDHLVETRQEVCIKEMAMEDGETDIATDELEVTLIIRDIY